MRAASSIQDCLAAGIVGLVLLLFLLVLFIILRAERRS